jgi:hypothetical protein
LTELHERIAYSSPPVHEGKVYVGVHDYGDDPIQNGKVIAVDPRATNLVLLTAVGLFWPCAAAQEKKPEKNSVADRSQIEVLTRFAHTLRIPKERKRRCLPASNANSGTSIVKSRARNSRSRDFARRSDYRGDRWQAGAACSR